MDTYLMVVVGQVITLFLMMGVGFLLFRLGRLERTGLDQMSFLLLYVVTPCVILESFQTDWDSALLHNLTLGTGLLTLSYGVWALLILPLFRRAGQAGAVLRFGAMYSNCGYMGLPLVEEVLGEGAMIYAAMCVAAFNLFAWTHGAALIGGRQAVSLRRALVNPGVIALACGLPLFLLRLRLPGMVGGAVGFLADLNTPLAMVIIGGQMAQADWISTFRSGRLYAAAGIKLLVMPAVTALILLPFHPAPLLYCTMVLLAAAPTAGLTSIFAQRFDRAPAAAAQLVTLSTLLCVVTMPLFAVLAQAITALK